ncbi:hypothetical protein [Amycolatopsis coloradensis]|uniref:hypothetical protein n=1 Tax=Amycolatopsis coloradensis TaxID=76021 RepID=UPI001177FA4A|nr:hypothetical protein [Amycolatopsis coloradensis]
MPAVDDAVALCAAGLILDSLLPTGDPVPDEIDLETLAYADSAFVIELRRRLWNVADRVRVLDPA